MSDWLPEFLHFRAYFIIFLPYQYILDVIIGHYLCFCSLSLGNIGVAIFWW